MGPNVGNFLLILDPWGISFHAVVVFALGKNFLFKSALGHCEHVPPPPTHRVLFSFSRVCTRSCTAQNSEQKVCSLVHRVVSKYVVRV